MLFYLNYLGEEFKDGGVVDIQGEKALSQFPSYNGKRKTVKNIDIVYMIYLTEEEFKSC